MSHTDKLSKESKFLQRLESIYPQDYSNIVSTLKQDLPKTFRINTLKKEWGSVVSSLASQGFDIKEASFKNSFICYNDSKDNRLSDTKEAKEMQIYIQELSSMIPTFILNLKAEDSILDLCASPGSKTTQIADIVKNQAEIVANEQSRDRFFKLQKIIKEYGAKVKTINENGKILPYKYKNYVQYFDKILVDAPCSNEASLRIDQHESFKFWRSSNSSGLAKLQKGLLASAISMLKPGGTLVYSTCTYAVEENESVVDWGLKKFPEIKLVDFKKDLALKNIQGGLTRYKSKGFDNSLSKSIRILPDGYFKGFFIAKIVKEK